MQWVAVQGARFHQRRPDPVTTTDLHAFAPGFVEKAEVWQVDSGEVRKKVEVRSEKEEESKE